MDLKWKGRHPEIKLVSSDSGGASNQQEEEWTAACPHPFHRSYEDRQVAGAGADDLNKLYVLRSYNSDSLYHSQAHILDRGL